MLRPIAVGVDGSPESLAAADWAAREAQRRRLPLRLVQAWLWQPQDVPIAQDPEVRRHWALRILREAEQNLGGRYPDLPISTEQIAGMAAEVLLTQAERADMLVLGSSGHGTIAGFLLGSVGQQVLAHAAGPVVMVRADKHAAAEAPGDEVVVAIQELGDPANEPLQFAFEAAAARGATLRAVHAWNLPALYGYGAAAGQLASQAGSLAALKEEALSAALAPWQEKYPQVQVTQTVDLSFASGAVLQAAERAALVVVGRTKHRPSLGMHVGPVAHAILHHAKAPVAVVPHD
ncbi:universal stress protein [Streptomyces xiangluensis]|uniref:Universal stress protein n=1 Tax=Streptomyces xiangluensis TaxID=2665720 RepID=A0ABV8YPI9_9ACTN